MSEISHSDELVTKQDLSNFYQGILPYLGGMPDVVGGGFAPVGTIIAFMGTSAPQDYLSCNGATYNIADYPQLTAFFAAQFGSVNKFGGDGATTFKVPDLRGEFLRGTGINSHANQGNGSNVGTHQDATSLPYLNVDVNGTIYATQWDTAQNSYILNADGGYSKGTLSNKGSSSQIASTWGQSTSTNMANVRPTNTSVLYCIKAIESGQVYSTEERKIGTWVNGKPIYQKTIDFGYLPNVESTKTVNHLISDISEVLDIKAIAKIPGTTWINVSPWVGGTTSPNSRLSVTASDVSMTNPTSVNMSGWYCYVTLQYTKS